MRVFPPSVDASRICPNSVNNSSALDEPALLAFHIGDLGLPRRLHEGFPPRPTISVTRSGMRPWACMNVRVIPSFITTVRSVAYALLLGDALLRVILL